MKLARENGSLLKFSLQIFIISQLLVSGALAQRQINGVIRGNSEILVGASIQNISRNRINISDMGGNYRISAAIGDTVVFSHEGYIADTLIIREYSFSDRLPVDLNIRVTRLHSVEVNEYSKYSADSLERRKDYDYIFEGKDKKEII